MTCCPGSVYLAQSNMRVAYSDKVPMSNGDFIHTVNLSPLLRVATSDLIRLVDESNNRISNLETSQLIEDLLRDRGLRCYWYTTRILALVWMTLAAASIFGILYQFSGLEFTSASIIWLLATLLTLGLVLFVERCMRSRLNIAISRINEHLLRHRMLVYIAQSVPLGMLRLTFVNFDPGHCQGLPLALVTKWSQSWGSDVSQYASIGQPVECLCHFANRHRCASRS